MENNNSIKDHVAYKFILLILVAVSFFISITLCILGIDYNNLIFLTIWSLIFLVLNKIKPKLFILTSTLLAFLEETIIYFLGGGLQGTAKSLIDDYLGSIPVFVMFILGWWLFLKKYDIDGYRLVFYSGLHGIVLEIVIPGHIFSITTVLLFAGTTFLVYGGMIVIPRRPEGTREANIKAIIKYWIFILILIFIGGLIADTARKLFIV